MLSLTVILMKSGEPIASDAYEKLSDNAYIVYKCYFSMSRRLALHNTLSQWTLSLLSLGLIVIPLLSVTKMPVRYNQSVVDFASITLAVGVLVFTLLITANNYAVRSEKAHNAGLELNDLIRKMRFHAKDSDRMRHYENFEEHYSDILKRFENCAQIDYYGAKLSIASGSWKIRIKYFFSGVSEILLYFVALALEFGFIGLLVSRPPAP
jgi:hypothetical protein